MNDSLQILHAIWERSTGAYIFLPTRCASGWDEGDALHVEVVDADIWQYEGYDYYFTPVRYIDTRRHPENQGMIGVLYADLDGAYDREVFDMFPPSVWWETSPGMEQAIWFLQKPIEWERAIELNRKLSVALKADHGSWIPTKLLRVPGTLNNKRGGILGRVLSFQPTTVYNVAYLESKLEALVTERPVRLESEMPVPPDHKQWQELLEKWWPKLDHQTKKMLLAAEVPDRSLHLARLAKRMRAISIPPQEIFGILHRLQTNKFYNRPEALWRSVVLTGDEAAG